MSILKNINYLTNVWQYPCATPGPVTIIKTAAEAAAPTLLELFSFSCTDILKLRLGISYRCGRTLKAIIKQAHPGKSISRLEWVYKFAGPVETGLYYFFIAELATSFLANWTSLVYQAEGCRTSADSCEYHASHGAASGVNPEVWLGIQYAQEQTGTCPGAVPFGFQVPNGWYWDVFFDITAEALFPNRPAPNIQTRLVKVQPSRFEYPPALSRPYPWQSQNTGHYHIGGHNPYEFNYERFVFECQFSDFAHSTGGTMALTMSRDPIPDSPHPGIGCLGPISPSAL